MRFKIFLFLVITIFASITNTYGQIYSLDEKFLKALRLFNNRDFNSSIAVYNNDTIQTKGNYYIRKIVLGINYAKLLSRDEAKNYLNNLEKNLPVIQNEKLQCEFNLGLGISHFECDEFNSSIDCFLKALIIANQLKNQRYEYIANCYLASNYLRLKLAPTSNVYCSQALNTAIEFNDSVEIVKCHFIRANNYIYYLSTDAFSYKYFDSIMILAKRAEKFINKTNNLEMAQLHNLYMKAFVAKDDHKARKFHALVSLEYYLKTNDLIGLSGAYISASQAFLSLGMFDSALYYQNQIEKIGVKLNSLPLQTLCVYYFNYYKIYSKLGNTKLSLKNLEDYVYANLDLEYENKIQITQSRENFEQQKNNQHLIDEKAKLEALYQQERIHYIEITIIIFIFFVLISYIIFYRLKFKRQQENSKLQILIQNAELTALKAQMNPHFIFNALNSIQHSIVTNNAEEAYRFLSKFSKLIRNVLDSSSEQLISLKSEIEMLNLYVEIESKRFDAQFSYNIEVDENGNDISKLLVPAMIFQPLIENAIWHGLLHKDGEKILQIKFHIKSESSIICIISDNGIGRVASNEINANRKNGHKSKGITNIMNRISLLEKTQLASINLQTIDDYNDLNEATGTTIIIEVKNKK
jgi:hypothetical protein